MTIVTYLINGLILFIYDLYGWYSLDNKFEIKNHKNYIALVIFVVLGSIINMYITNMLKMILITILLALLANWAVFNNIRKAIASTIVIQFVAMISEVLVAMVINCFFSINAMDLINNSLYCIILNLVIAIISIIIISLKIVRKSYSFIIKITAKIKENNLIKYSLTVLLFATVLTFTIYIKQSFEVVIAVNTLAIILFCWWSIKMLKSETKYEETAKNYNTSKALLQSTENDMNNYMIDNHEIKKELRIIENMLLDGDPSLPEYIEALKIRFNMDDIKEGRKKQIEKIPLKLLQYLIKDKIVEIDKTKIQFNIYISKRVKKSQFLKLNKQDEFDICDSVNIFIENAITATERLSERVLSFELYPDVSSICIIVSNNYEGHIPIDKISNPGYTTKGKGHGYGLSLVKKIVDQNDKLIHETEISKDEVKQILKIKV